MILRHPVMHILGQKGRLIPVHRQDTYAPQTTFYQAKHPNLMCNTPYDLADRR